MEIKTLKDLIVIGGGINGVGIAADAAGRGLSVLVLEAHDLACATSSASSKLIHGGLRYLEHYEFKLVSEALSEREIILKSAPHIVCPLRFRLPHCSHLRPAWMIRMGLFIYDHLRRNISLPKSKSIRFCENSSVLETYISRGFEYSDCWVDDARLVVSNAQEVIRHGSEVHTRFRVIGAKRENNLWHVTAEDIDSGKIVIWRSKGLVNAAGPWVNKVLEEVVKRPSQYRLRLIKGSHIVVPRIHAEPYAYILQHTDHRIIFVIPWMEAFSLIGTTDIEYKDNPKNPIISEEEISYLLEVCNHYFKKKIYKQDIIWSYSGVRPLYDDKSNKPQYITRNYVLDLNEFQGKTPLISIFGGKITSYRKLAEQVLNMLAKFFPHTGAAWTQNNILPGGHLGRNRVHYANYLYERYGFLGQSLAKRYAYTYGSNSELILKDISKISDLGENFGHDFYEAELHYLVKNEWVYTIEDAIWRRTKLGIWLTQLQQKRIVEWLNFNAPKRSLF
ncbi:MAG: glycerol-3-phosphate dehydrogenase [Candidatus Dasytiphilus stammeri]